MQTSYLRSAKKTQAIKLRQKGLLISEIATQLEVSKSTIHGWVSGLELTSEQQFLIDARLAVVNRSKIRLMNDANRKKRLEKEHATLLLAESIVKRQNLGKHHKQLICAMLFWCEGSKDISSGPRFINSDPVMVKLYLSLLRTAFDVDESKFRALIHLHDYHDQQIQLNFWSEVTKIPRSQFHNSYLKPHTGKNTREGYPGCVSISYYDKQLGLLLNMIYNNFGNNLGE
jgi:hypothetical protein